MIWKALLKAKEDSLIPKEKRNEYRAARRKFEGRDKLADQVTSAPGVSDRGIEVRRGDSRNKGAISHGYGRVHEDPKKHMAQAKKMFSKSTKLNHYSPQVGLKEIDPDKMGSGADSRTPGRNTERKYSFYYRAGAPLPPEDAHIHGQARSKYTVNVPSHYKLYDIGTDPEGHLARLNDESQNKMVNRGIVNWGDKVDRLHSLGYHGFFTSADPKLSSVVGLFHKMPVHSEESK